MYPFLLLIDLLALLAQKKSFYKSLYHNNDSYIKSNKNKINIKLSWIMIVFIYKNNYFVVSLNKCLLKQKIVILVCFPDNYVFNFCRDESLQNNVILQVIYFLNTNSLNIFSTIFK
jgi:hypothetical protein